MTFTSPAPAAEVMKRLAASIDLEKRSVVQGTRYPGNKRFVGAISQDRFRVRVRPRIAHGFVPQMQGRIWRTEREGSEVDVEIALPRRTALGALLYVVTVAFVVAAGIVVGPAAVDLRIVAPWLVALTAFAVAITAFARRGAADDERALTALAHEVFGAASAPPADASRARPRPSSSARRRGGTRRPRR